MYGLANCHSLAWEACAMASRRNVYVAGIGMTPFGKFPDRNLKSLSQEAVHGALEDAGASTDAIEGAYVANAVAGLITGQEMVRGQVMLHPLGIHSIPVINVENACASASSAFHLAYQAVASGTCDIALALGVEKMTHPNKEVSLAAIGTAIDVEAREEMVARLGTSGANRSFFMDIYAGLSKELMERTGIDQEDFARVVVKNHRHAALNPKAQYRNKVTMEEVLGSREIVFPLTLLMCSPIGDGAAAAVLASEDGLGRLSGGNSEGPVVKVLASVLRSGSAGPGASGSAVEAARKAYEQADVGPDDIDCAEVHDATAPAELILYEELGFAEPDEISALLLKGETALGGSRPINPSGGLLCKGHPIGASGIAQIAEVVTQLRGEAGDRQVEGARLGLTENGGGWLGHDSAAVTVHVLGQAEWAA